MLDLGYPPHLTLITSDHAEAERGMEAALSELASQSPPMLELGTVRRFPGTDVVWIGCVDETGLRQLHARIARHVPGAFIRPHYKAGEWTPHVTLQIQGNAKAGLSLAEAAWRPMQAQVHQVELVRSPPPVAIRTIDLLGRA